jgi:archaellum component FlaC
MQEKRVKRVQKSHFRGTTMDEQEKQLTTAFVQQIARTLESHRQSLELLSNAVTVLQHNSQTEHENVQQIAEQVSAHHAILEALKAEIARRMGMSEGEDPAPAAPIN